MWLKFLLYRLADSYWEIRSALSGIPAHQWGWTSCKGKREVLNITIHIICLPCKYRLLIVKLFDLQERMETTKRGWELQQQQKLKVEKEEQMILEDEEDLLSYTREDAYNMVQRYFSSICYVEYGVVYYCMLKHFYTFFIGVCVWQWGWTNRNNAGKFTPKLNFFIAYLRYVFEFIYI